MTADGFLNPRRNATTFLQANDAKSPVIRCRWGDKANGEELHGSTYGRVTLYVNPHDQVISATPVQRMGWRGMSAQEIADTGGEGVFTQRVFAQNHLVSQETAKDHDICRQ